MKAHIHYTTFWLSLLISIFSFNALNAQKVDGEKLDNKKWQEKFHFDLGLNFKPFGTYFETNYKIKEDYYVSLRYENSYYCFLCGWGESSGSSWGMRQLIVGGFFKRHIGNLGVSVGPQYVIGFPRFGENHSGNRVNTPNHRFGASLGLNYKRFSIKMARRVPQILTIDDWHLFMGVLLGEYK